MGNKKLRLAISVLVVLATIIAFWLYLSVHRNLITQLSQTSLVTIGAVFLLYLLMLVVLMLILDATLRVCTKTIGKKENVIINAYTLLINFFGPGQGGPVFRGYYLKKKHSIKYRNYISASLIYYLFYGLIGLFMLLLGSQPWRLSLLAIVLLLLLGAGSAAIYYRVTKLKKAQLNLSVAPLAYLFLATAIQAILQTIIYAVELHSANRSITLHQVITYAGAANLTVFVALTPGAIGIRETFLVFTERLHHISSANIVVANVIDRSVYVTFLISLAIALIIISYRSKDRILADLLPEKLGRKLHVTNQQT